jgi:predicted molibdopterin-dependent oxidoreductase YjgC
MARKAREGVMEFLLINHPLDCPICDQAHAAIAGDREPLMVAETRDLRSRRLGGLEQRVFRGNVDLDAINDDFRHLQSHSAAIRTDSECGFAA